jgi:outer membrane translocation and assembly module TamA
MGPLRLDLGYSRYNNEGGPGVIKPHFSIGQKF